MIRARSQRARGTLLWRLACVCALATGAARADGDFLDPEGAFALAVRAVDATRIELRFDVAPGYHLYRDKVVASTDPAGILAPIALPRGSVEHDATFAKDVEVFRGVVKAELPVARADAAFRLVVSHQGCADAGLCYSPVAHAFRVEPDATGLRVVALLDSDATAAQQASSGGTARRAIAAPAPADDAGNGFAGALHSRSLVRVALVFALAGLLLSLTPCVLPMVPILASIIVGQGTVSRARGFLLAASYALGMALVYTAFGTAAGLAGEGLAAALQNGWTLGAFALLLAALSLSMFGLYEVQMPSALQTRLAQLSSRLRGGHHLGVFAMGGASALVVGPCVAAPLAGALLYISQTRDVAIGGVALFSLAAGMSVPLLLVGVSAGSLLPRAGAWMERVKHVFGALLLAIALWTVSPVLPAWATMVAVAALLLAAAAYLGAFERSSDGALSPPRALVKSVALMLACGALLELVGVASGGNDALRPLRPLAVAAAAQARSSGAVSTVAFRAVEDLDALEREVRASPRPVMIDVYADWCVACKELETLTFADDAVREQLAKMTLLRVDVSANSAADRALLRRHGLFGPPALLFFAPAGDELAASRVIGFENAASLRERLDRVVAATVASRGGQE